MKKASFNLLLQLKCERWPKEYTFSRQPFFIHLKCIVSSWTNVSSEAEISICITITEVQADGLPILYC